MFRKMICLIFGHKTENWAHWTAGFKTLDEYDIKIVCTRCGWSQMIERYPRRRRTQ